MPLCPESGFGPRTCLDDRQYSHLLLLVHSALVYSSYRLQASLHTICACDIDGAGLLGFDYITQLTPLICVILSKKCCIHFICPCGLPSGLTASIAVHRSHG